MWHNVGYAFEAEELGIGSKVHSLGRVVLEVLPDGNRDTRTFSSMSLNELVLCTDCNLERRCIPLCECAVACVEWPERWM